MNKFYIPDELEFQDSPFDVHLTSAYPMPLPSCFGEVDMELLRDRPQLVDIMAGNFRRYIRKLKLENFEHGDQTFAYVLRRLQYPGVYELAISLMDDV